MTDTLRDAIVHAIGNYDLDMMAAGLGDELADEMVRAVHEWLHRHPIEIGIKLEVRFDADADAVTADVALAASGAGEDLHRDSKPAAGAKDLS